MDASNVPDGTASHSVYLVQYDENQWLRYDEAGHQFCYDTWIARAKPLGCKYVVLKLIPDTLFPRDPAKPLPYTAWQQEIVPETRKGFKLDARVWIELDEGTADIDVPLRHRIETALREYPNGTAYDVRVKIGPDKWRMFLAGKVSK